MANNPQRWPEEVEMALFRIAQEALTNAAKHASAKRITIFVDEQKGSLK